MERKGVPKQIWMIWILPAIGLLAAVYLYCFVSGCGFLGIVLAVAALIHAGFILLGLWKKRNQKAARSVQIALRILLYFVTIAVIISLVPILRGPAQVQCESDYLIVLGAGVQGTEPSQILRDRIEEAAEYLQNNPNVICIATGGKGNGENISEAQCIFNHLTAMGIHEDRIWLEDQATSTIENFRYSIALIEEKTGAVPKTVTVLSNEFHLFRASRMAKDCGLEANFVAAPTSDFLVRISYTIREVFALWKYLIMGG